jgi:glc operon protein GlcG
MVITVVDDGGNVMFLERMDETQLGSIEVAIEKAKSAVNFKRPTKAFEDVLAGGRTAVLKLPGSMPVEGGIPLMVDGKILGAIGVSGGTSAQDGQAATSAVEALPKIIGRS